MNNALLCAAVLSAGWPFASQAAGQAQASVQSEVRTERAADVDTLPPAYVLGPADQIVIHASDVPDISGKPQRLDPNGDLKLPMIGRVHAAGMTLDQLERELTERLKVYLEEPDVAVTVTEFHSQPVSVIGAVGTSGIHQLEGRKTIIEVLSMAGGVGADAGPSLRITRRLEWGRVPLPGATEDTTGGFSIAEIDLRSLLDARNPEQNITVRPYDVISVPRAETVYIVGEVARPGPLPLSGGHSISVIEALSSSGGVLRTAAPGHARILRRIPGDQKRVELKIDLKQIMQGKANDLPLAAGDILVVPDSSGKKVTARAIEALVQVGTFIGTYGVLR
jgi:polysaccharide export outer membrane protein